MKTVLQDKVREEDGKISGNVDVCIDYLSLVERRRRERMKGREGEKKEEIEKEKGLYCSYLRGSRISKKFASRNTDPFRQTVPISQSYNSSRMSHLCVYSCLYRGTRFTIKLIIYLVTRKEFLYSVI